MQQVNTNIKIDSFTGQENTTYNLNGAGLQVKEIAEQMGVAYETVKSYMKSIKEKLGLSKDKEITAHYWCKLVGIDFDEVKKQIISSCTLLLIAISLFSPMGCRTTNMRTRTRCNTTAKRYETLYTDCFYSTTL